VNWRSVLLGLAGVFFICGLTAYNDYVVANTFLVGNLLPIGLLLFFITFILLINTPLRRFAPHLAFGMPEVGVALCMMLVSCAIPGSGMMRYLPGHLVGVWPRAADNIENANVLQSADLPWWVFPRMERADVRERGSEPVINDFMQRTPDVGPTFMDRVGAVPWSAWAVPAITWGVLAFFLFGAIICLGVILRRQWVENERLPYPLATVYLSLIEEPKPGKCLNALFGSRTFWIAFLAVFLIHGINALNQYEPKVFPVVPLNYNFWNIFADTPLRFAQWGFKANRLYFCMIGITFFLQSNVALSIWLIYFVVEVLGRMFIGEYRPGSEFTGSMGNDQTLGAAIPFALAILWVGRQHFLMVLQQMFRRPREGEPQGRYLPYSLAGWGLVICALGMMGWLWSAGAEPFAAVGIVLFCGLSYLVVARVVAETGIIFVQLPAPVHRPFAYLAQSMPESLAYKVSIKSFFYAAFFNTTFVADQRESLAGFVPQALRIGDGAAYENERRWRRAIPFTACLLGALLIGYLVAGASMLYTEYNYTATADRKQESPINSYGVRDSVNNVTLSSVRDFALRGGPNENHNRWMHMGIGASVTSVLSFLRLRFVGWPLHPVGFLLVYSYPIANMWFSVMVGWLAKVLIVRFGGATLYRGARPFFVGIIVGEVGAAAFWLVVSLVLNAMGMSYVAIRLLPG
jgi:hypothetical protein